MKDHGRKSNWTAQLSPYLKSLKIKSLIPSPKSPRSPKSPGSSSLPRSPRRPPPEHEDASFQIIHTPDRPERPIPMTAVPNDEQCMKFLMSLQKQEENKRGAVKTGLTMWPYPDEEIEDRRCLRSVRVESVHLEEARLARTNSSGPARVVEVGRSSTKSTMTTARRSSYLPSPAVSDFDDTDEFDDDVEEKVDTTVRVAPLSPPPTLSRSQSRLSQYLRTPRAQTSRWSDDSESLFSSRDNDSPCPQRETMRSSAEVSSPTMVDDDSAGPSSPPFMTPVKDRPATPFADPRLRSISDPTTPPPTNHIVHHISPESLPRSYSWRSSKETVLSTGAPVSRFHSWLPEPRAKEEARSSPEPEPEAVQMPTPPPQARSTPQLPEIEVYGDWADYYFEDGNFWDECSGDDDVDADEEDYGDNEESEQTLLEEDDDDEKEASGRSSEDEEKGKQKTGHLEVDEGNVYPRYESFIKDYKNNVMSITVTEV